MGSELAGYWDGFADGFAAACGVGAVIVLGVLAFAAALVRNGGR